MGKIIKAQLLTHCLDFIDSKYQTLQSEYRLYQESAANETKSTAGDKHDTSKSMMQLEQEKLGHQLEILQKQKKILGNIDVNRVSRQVEFGSVVETNLGNFFISISAKEFKVEDKLFIPVSVQSPLAISMLNKAEGEQVNFNNKIYKITSIN
jgi:transcription elongation GreA/GreB family factor